MPFSERAPERAPKISITLNSDAFHGFDSTKLQRINYSVYLKKKQFKMLFVQISLCVCVLSQTAGGGASAKNANLRQNAGHSNPQHCGPGTKGWRYDSKKSLKIILGLI